MTPGHSIIESLTFLADGKDAGMGADERAEIVQLLAANPYVGDIMVGTGGARKHRIKRPGTGKRDGYRVVFYDAGADVPVFLLNVFTKGDRANHSKPNRMPCAVSFPGWRTFIERGENREQAC